MIRFAVGSMTIGIAVTVLSGQAPPAVDPALRAAITAHDKAVAARDAAAVERLLADDYSAVNPAGSLTSKAQRVSGLKNPPTNPNPVLTVGGTEEGLRVYGTSALRWVRNPGNRAMELWTRTAQGWQRAYAHVVPDSKPPASLPDNRVPKAEPSAWPTPPGLSGDRAAVMAVQKQLQDARFTGDQATYAKHTASDHVRIGPAGVLTDAGAVKSVDVPRRQPAYSEVSVFVWGDLAAVRWREKGQVLQQWLTRVFARRDGSWQQVLTASSPAAAP